MCCVYESVCPSTSFPLRCGHPQRETATPLPGQGDLHRPPPIARRVFASFGKKLGAETEYLVSRDFLSGQEDKELLLLRFLHLAFALGPGTVKREGHPVVAPLYAMKKSLDWEVDKFQGFVRFEEHDGMLGAVIHPKNYILPLLRPHFCGRFPEEDFMIYDAVHQAVLLHEGHKTQLLELAAPLELPPPSAREQQFQALWTQFYKNAGNQSAPQRKRPHDPLPQALLGRYGGNEGEITMKTGKKTGRWKYAVPVLILVLILALLGLLWNNVNNTSNSTDEIYLYGEWHSDSHILDRELEIWGEYYKKGMRDLFVEYPYTDAQFLNLWMQADDDELLDQQLQRLGGHSRRHRDRKELSEADQEDLSKDRVPRHRCRPYLA